jgi:ribulose 1,5-bisphosphate synthetase/thiazole synthase
MSETATEREVMEYDVIIVGAGPTQTGPDGRRN